MNKRAIQTSSFFGAAIFCFSLASYGGFWAHLFNSLGVFFTLMTFFSAGQYLVWLSSMATTMAAVNLAMYLHGEEFRKDLMIVMANHTGISVDKMQFLPEHVAEYDDAMSEEEDAAIAVAERFVGGKIAPKADGHDEIEYPQELESVLMAVARLHSEAGTASFSMNSLAPYGFDRNDVKFKGLFEKTYAWMRENNLCAERASVNRPVSLTELGVVYF